VEALKRAALPALAFLLVPLLAARSGAARGGFRIDEAHKIAQSAVVRAWPHPRDPAWTQTISDRTDPPVGKYVFALAIAASGGRVPELPTLGGYAPNGVVPGLFPAEVTRRYEACLPAARWASTLAMALTAALVAWCAARAGGTLGALVAIALFVTNYTTQLLCATAVFDPLLTMFATLALALAASPRARSIGAMIAIGVAGALAFQTRLNGALFFAVTLAVVLPRARSRAAAAIAAFVAVTLAVNPYYWPNPIARFAAQIADARQLLGLMPARLTTLSAKWRFFAEIAGGDVAGLLLLAAALAGALVLALRWRALSEAARLTGVWCVAAIVVFVVWLPVAWPRYILATVPPLCCLAAIGCGAFQRAITSSVTFTRRSMASTITAATSRGSMKPARRSGQNGVSIPPGATLTMRAFVPFASARSASL
jgi:hypothetical protein